jgi:hypothetical protein
MLFLELIVICCESCAKRVNTLCGQNMDFCMVKRVVCIVVVLNPLEPGGKCVSPGSALKILCFAHKVYLCVFCVSYNEQDSQVDCSDEVHPSQ